MSWWPNRVRAHQRVHRAQRVVRSAVEHPRSSAVRSGVVTRRPSSSTQSSGRRSRVLPATSSRSVGSCPAQHTGTRAVGVPSCSAYPKQSTPQIHAAVRSRTTEWSLVTSRAAAAARQGVSSRSRPRVDTVQESRPRGRRRRPRRGRCAGCPARARVGQVNGCVGDQQVVCTSPQRRTSERRRRARDLWTSAGWRAVDRAFRAGWGGSAPRPEQDTTRPDLPTTRAD